MNSATANNSTGPDSQGETAVTTPSTHNVEHEMFLPRTDEQETFASLDGLLTYVTSVKFDPDLAAAAINQHVARLFANLESTTPFRTRPIGDPFNISAPWLLHTEVNSQIDRALLTIKSGNPECPTCAKLWEAHLLNAKNVLSRWSGSRELNRLLY